LKNNFLIILISPSGGGKSVILKRLLARNSDIEYSISFTTRKMRKNEERGTSYHFISVDKFTEMQEQNDFLESALVHQNWYGTSKSFIESRLKSGKHIIMDIDVQGAKQILTKMDAVTIFVLPPSREIWLNRLNDRGTESTEDLEIRLESAEKEIAEIGDFQYLVINDELENAVKNIENIIRVEEKKIKRYSKIDF